MASMNQVFLIGRLGQDPEKRTAGTSVVTRLNLATSRKYKNRDGEQQEETQWHSVDCWGKTGELAAQYLRKGSQVLVEGSIKYSTSGEGESKKYFTNIFCNRLQFLDSKGSSPSAGEGAAAMAAIDDTEEVPF